MNHKQLCLFLIPLLLAAGCNLRFNRATPTPPASVLATPEFGYFPPADGGSGTVDPNAPVLNPACSATPPTWVAYTVVAGDTLGLLAMQTDSSVEEIVAGNCLDSADSIYIDQMLYLPKTPVVSP